MESNATLQKRKLIDAGLASDADFLGCSEAEVAHLEQQFKVKLPAAFIDFLRVMGKERDGFYAEASMSYPFDDMRRIAVDLLNDVNEKLSETAFVFVERYGCAVLYFETTSGDDPPIFVCQEDDKSPSKVAPNFSEWLTAAVDSHIAGCRKLEELESR
jgi:hypothetical protein